LFVRLDFLFEIKSKKQKSIINQYTPIFLARQKIHSIYNIFNEDD